MHLYLLQGSTSTPQSSFAQMPGEVFLPPLNTFCGGWTEGIAPLEVKKGAQEQGHLLEKAQEESISKSQHKSSGLLEGPYNLV